MPYIDSAYMAKGMTMDKTFLGWGIGQERNEAESWFELLARAGVIFKKVQPHPTTPDHPISTWQLFESQEGNQSASETDLRPAESQHDAKSPWPSSQATANPTESKPEVAAQAKESPVAVWQSLLGSPA